MNLKEALLKSNEYIKGLIDGIKENYVKKTDVAFNGKTGLVNTNSVHGHYVDSNGRIYNSSATDAEIDARTNEFKIISPKNLEHAVTSVVDFELGEQEQVTFVEESDLDGYVKNTDYAEENIAGVLMAKDAQGFGMVNGSLYVRNMSISDYTKKGNTAAISKGTLENILPSKVAENAPVKGVKVATVAQTIDSDGYAVVQPATDSDIKAANSRSKLITSIQIGNVSFYGLAKASGDTTQQTSSNPVGQYTEEAKNSIREMIDVPSKDSLFSPYIDDDGGLVVGDVGGGNEWELIYDLDLTESSLISFNELSLKRAYVYIYTPASTSVSNDVNFYFDNSVKQFGNTSYNMPSTAIQRTLYYCNVNDGIPELYRTQIADTGNMAQSYIGTFNKNNLELLTGNIKAITTIRIGKEMPIGSKIILYGIRA